MNILPLPTATIDDDDVARALRRSLVVVNPLVALMATDPVGLKKRTHLLWESDSVPARVLDGLAWVLDTADVPGTKAWEAMSLQDRIDWWVYRVGAIDTLLVAFPGVLGVIADRLPIQDALGFASQSIVLCAVARECGVTDVDAQVQLIGAVMCQRDLAGDGGDEAEPGTNEQRNLAEAAWHLAGLVRAAGDELGKRPRPRAVFRYLGMLPAVGVVADYLGEYGALVRAAKEGSRWITSHGAQT